MARSHSSDSPFGRPGFEPRTGRWVDTPTSRGFPLGGLGSGGISWLADGGFGESRITRNWMRPLKGLRGSFFAVRWAGVGEKPQALVLRGAAHGYSEYAVPTVAHTAFRGVIPEARLYTSGTGPLEVSIAALSPLVPGDIDLAALPVALFNVEVHNRSDHDLDVSVLLSWEAVLGWSRSIALPWMWSHAMRVDARRQVQAETLRHYPAGIVQRLHPDWPLDDPRRRACGDMIVAFDTPAEASGSALPLWDAASREPSFWAAWRDSGDLPTDAKPPNKPKQPAGAVSVRLRLAPGARSHVPARLLWHLPRFPLGKHLLLRRFGIPAPTVDVGSPAARFADIESLDLAVVSTRSRVESGARRMAEIFDDPDLCNLPAWLTIAIRNSADSVLVNSVLTGDGELATIEGVDWSMRDKPAWPFGGLTGTIDQQLMAQPYVGTFFPDLHRRELDRFRELTVNGRVPHGSGNVEIQLGTTAVPYGRPLPWPHPEMYHWPDLAMSWILLAGLTVRRTGDIAWLTAVWRDLRRMARWLDSRTKRGVPEGGSTYELHDYRPVFLYHSTMYAATQRMLAALAPLIPGSVEPEGARLAGAFQGKADRAMATVDKLLWDERGFWHACHKRPILFQGGLAGEWALRQAGLPPLLAPDRLQSHLEWQHKSLVQTPLAGGGNDAGLPLPLNAADVDGNEIPVKIISRWRVRGLNYIAQQIAFQAQTAISAGRVGEGLQLIRMVINKVSAEGYPWDIGKVGRPGYVHMSHPILWATLQALAGAWIDRTRRSFGLDPQPLPGESRLRLPIFFPGLWLALDWDFSAGRGTLTPLPQIGHIVLDEPGLLKLGPLGGTTRDITLPAGWSKSQEPLQIGD
jgi:uncharacterized protein (DUF608 family)